MRHVHQEHGSDGIGNLAKTLEIDDSRVSAGTRDDHLRLVLPGEPR
jgi:hypothetical protein